MDREKYLARKRCYHERHREQDAERNKRWREANKERLSEKQCEYRLAHPTAGYEGVKRWRSSNPDWQVASTRASACNRRAKAAGVQGHISRLDVTSLWDRQPACVRCGQGRGVDHIIDFRHGGENTPDNLQNLCRTCNELKAAKLTFDDAEAIRAQHAAGKRRAELAAAWGVTPGNIWLIVTNRTWRAQDA